MVESYQKVARGKEDLPSNEIRVRKDDRIGKYLGRAVSIFNGDVKECQEGAVVIKGVEKAMENAMKLAELIKHRVKGLHQVTKISNLEIVDEYEPLYEGLDPLVFKSYKPMLTVTLSTSQLDTTDPGYQAPIAESEV